MIDTITTIKGIEAFINLEVFDCGYNKIDSIDLSSNEVLEILKARNNEPLSYINLNNNYSLEELEITSQRKY